MADPEDGDDLFADLYDADDSTNRTTVAVEAPKSTDLATIPAAGESAGQDFAPAPVGTYESRPTQPSESDPGYHNGSGNAYGAPANAQAPSPVETESHGTGIKEDG
ncbi:hypothetical protein PDIG_86440 [Penicillium digitatum PHI26]|uniref:Uncharacterized protein n=3 Tax=Penicillium digitatum TaxID=36651 RepID=K9FQ48_PEND2|nr:hypothetical protein PDIP_32460 [Penicillium digitatum Pd1]EKV04843.1 hypothetical protein PDIG_86440 [Penicillium digitatum PHI26]EKV17230.1 hypothetical protein PDIP_32460 [Penicillium digitatum Pd1]